MYAFQRKKNRFLKDKNGTITNLFHINFCPVIQCNRRPNINKLDDRQTFLLKKDIFTKGLRLSLTRFF